MASTKYITTFKNFSYISYREILRECVITSIISKALYKVAIAGGGIVKKKLDRDAKNCRRVNEELLFKILWANRKSEIGIKFNFRDIRSIEFFKKTSSTN